MGSIAPCGYLRASPGQKAANPSAGPGRAHPSACQTDDTHWGQLPTRAMVLRFMARRMAATSALSVTGSTGTLRSCGDARHPAGTRATRGGGQRLCILHFLKTRPTTQAGEIHACSQTHKHTQKKQQKFFDTHTPQMSSTAPSFSPYKHRQKGHSKPARPRRRKAQTHRYVKVLAALVKGRVSRRRRHEIRPRNPALAGLPDPTKDASQKRRVARSVCGKEVHSRVGGG